MNSLIQSIFIKIAQRLGLELTPKDVESLDYFETNDISITSAMASRTATLVLLDSDINIAGDNQRAKYMNEIIEELEEVQLKTAVEVSLGTGDSLIKPYIKGDRIGYNIISADDFYVTEAVGKHIMDCLVKCDSFKEKNHVYVRIERHQIEDAEQTKFLRITQLAYKDGERIDIDRVERWADIEPETVIPNVDSMLFGRIKCPTVNRGDLNSNNGVPITYGMDKVLKNAVKRYDGLNQEFDDKETMVFMDKTLFEKDSNGNRTMPKRKLFQKVRAGLNSDQQLIHEYSPDIRDSSMTEGVQQNFKMLELLAGLSAGILTSPTTNYATATEMKASLELTFAFIQAVRKQIENAVDAVTKGTNYLMNLNNITPMGEYEVIYNWSDSYIQDMTARFMALVQGHAIGAVTEAEVRSFIQNEPLDVAEDKINEIKEPLESDIE